MAALSDTILLGSVELSELERQKKECYFRGRSGNSDWKMDRASGKKTRRLMDVDDLVDAADAERKRKKDLRDLRRQSNKPSGDPKLSKQQQTGRAAQSKRDKEKAAKDKAAKAKKEKTGDKDKEEPK